jgi:hypothetical protein
MNYHDLTITLNCLHRCGIDTLVDIAWLKHRWKIKTNLELKLFAQLAAWNRATRLQLLFN